MFCYTEKHIVGKVWVPKRVFLRKGRQFFWFECPAYNIPDSGPCFCGREAFYDGFVLGTQHGLTGEFQGVRLEKV